MIFNEVLGYLATAIVALSFLMKQIRNLRMVNSVGAFLFIVYGFVIQSYPVCITNAFILCVNLFHIFRDLKQPSENVKARS